MVKKIFKIPLKKSWGGVSFNKNLLVSPTTKEHFKKKVSKQQATVERGFDLENLVNTKLE